MNTFSISLLSILSSFISISLTENVSLILPFINKSLSQIVFLVILKLYGSLPKSVGSKNET